MCTDEEDVVDHLEEGKRKPKDPKLKDEEEAKRAARRLPRAALRLLRHLRAHAPVHQ